MDSGYFFSSEGLKYFSAVKLNSVTSDRMNQQVTHGEQGRS